MNKPLRLLLLLFLPFILFSCEKKFLEIVPVLQIEDDISIPNGGNIKYLSFPSALVGYAAADTNFINKTTNGGKSWEKLFVSGSTSKCRGVEFFDNLKGMVLMGNAVYVTENGGQTWSYKQDGSFIGIADGQKGIIGRADLAPAFTPGPREYCTIFASTNQGKTFQVVGKVEFENEFTFGKVTGTKVYASGKDAFFNDSFHGIDLNTQEELTQFTKLIYSDFPTDIFINEFGGAVVGNNGIIHNISENRRDQYRHTYTYNSVDGYGNLFVAVGNHTITSTLDLQSDETWNEVFDRDGNSFEHTFYKIRFFDQNRFYLSGNKGLLWKAKL